MAVTRRFEAVQQHPPRDPNLSTSCVDLAIPQGYRSNFENQDFQVLHPGRGRNLGNNLFRTIWTNNSYDQIPMFHLFHIFHMYAVYCIFSNVCSTWARTWAHIWALYTIYATYTIYMPIHTNIYNYIIMLWLLIRALAGARLSNNCLIIDLHIFVYMRKTNRFNSN